MGTVLVNTFVNTLSSEQLPKWKNKIMLNAFGLQSKFIRLGLVGMNKDQLIWYVVRDDFVREMPNCYGKSL